MLQNQSNFPVRIIQSALSGTPKLNPNIPPQKPGSEAQGAERQGAERQGKLDESDSLQKRIEASLPSAPQQPAPVIEVEKKAGIARQLPNGEIERLIVTEPKMGGDHRDHIFPAIESLLASGMTPADFEGLLVERYINGKVETTFEIKAKEIEKYLEFKEKGMIPEKYSKKAG